MRTIYVEAQVGDNCKDCPRNYLGFCDIFNKKVHVLVHGDGDKTYKEMISGCLPECRKAEGKKS